MQKIPFGLLLSLFFNLPVTGAQPVLEIWEIQGTGLFSPYESEWVRSNGNIVSAIDKQGFFMQTPPARSDNRGATSDGIYVFTEQNPDVALGDSVSVLGRIKEQFGLTEFTDVSLVLQLGKATGLPAPVELDASFPGTSPALPRPLEQVEGMRVQTVATVVGPTTRFGEFAVTANALRPFREPGIAFPGRNGLPVWDGNPELFLVDPDGIGAADYPLAQTGDTISATGVLTYRFGNYHFLPENYQITTAPPTGQPVRAPRSGEFTLATLNTFLLLKGEDNYSNKVEKLARYILDVLQAPDIIALQEVGSFSAVQDLAGKINSLNPGTNYQFYFGASPDFIHLAYLVRPRVEVLEVTALQAEERFSQGGLLHGRPPLLLSARLEKDGPQIEVLNLHLRSLRNIEDPDEGPAVRRLRYEQSVSVARLVEERRENNLFVIGDFNAFAFSDGYVDVVNQISGGPSLGALFPVAPIVTRPLENLTMLAPADQRYSFIQVGNAQLLDHCLAGVLSGVRVGDLQFARGNADAPFVLSEDVSTTLRSSDHDGFVVYIRDLSVAIGVSSTETPGVQLSPNPVRSGQPVRLDITLSEPQSAKLFSVNGRAVSQWLFDGKGPFLINIPDRLAAGYYLLRLQTAEGMATLPLLVQP